MASDGLQDLKTFLNIASLNWFRLNRQFSIFSLEWPPRPFCIILTLYAGDSVDGNGMSFEALASRSRLVAIRIVYHTAATVSTGVTNMKTTIGICNAKTKSKLINHIWS